MTTSIAGRFAEVASAHPTLPALICPDRTMTFEQLAGAAGAVAARIRGGPVGLRIRDGAKMVTAILGALAAGQIYVPLDPGYPEDRLRLMASDAGAALTLTDDDIDLNAEAPLEVKDGREAYILYTSGSTGRPKGVVQRHAGVLYQALGHVSRLGITPADRVSVLSSFGYDMAVTDTFCALPSGAAAVPIDLKRTGMAELAEALRRHGVSIYHSTPTVFRHLLGAVQGRGLPSIRAVVLGGEKVNRSDVDRARAACSPELVFINGYGATEISFVAQNHLRPGDDAGSVIVPIGKPLPGCEIELSAEGEIVITSEFLATYWNSSGGGIEELGGGRRRYRTGDLGEWLPDGSLAYLGRLDRQIKLRGYRIEPAEIEHALVSQPGVREAAVRVAGDTLVAYVVGEAEEDDLRRALQGSLPDFMVPARFVTMDALPLTPTGKVDMRALPDPAAVSVLDGGAPQSLLEKQIAATWCEVLGSGEVGREVNFFDAGGDSLRLARVQQELEAALDIRIPLTDMLAHPSVASLARHLENGQSTIDAVLDRIASRTAQRAAHRRARR